MNGADDTIFALSSGRGKAGIAVIRISGRDCLQAVGSHALKPRMATVVGFHDIDNLVAIYFKAPASFTGEDLLELHCHGGAAVVEAVFAKLRGFGFRMAEAGEFSRRAFQNGKMNLIEIDAMRALIDARTERQRKRALSSLVGSDGAVYMKWREDMIELAALSAARMDYASDELPGDIGIAIAARLKALLDKIAKALSSKAHKIERGFNIVISGGVNVGKSSLFNRLLGESRAIVSDVPGTTRDVISAELDLGGFYARLLDTAGLRESADEIEKAGIDKALDQAKNADIVLRVIEPTESVRKVAPDEIIVVNKSDLIKDAEPKIADAVYVSAKTGRGVSELLDRIRRELDGQAGEDDLVVTQRIRGHLIKAAENLSLALAENLAETESEHIALAADEIGLILGFIGSDEIYDSVFGQLCLGK